MIRFRDVYADWPDLFGGERGFVLKAGAFPELAASTTPDLSDMMLDSIPFSGGPWMLRSWGKGRAVLVRNARYFGARALLTQVTLVPLTSLDREVQEILERHPAVRTGSAHHQFAHRDEHGHPGPLPGPQGALKKMAGGSQPSLTPVRRGCPSPETAILNRSSSSQEPRTPRTRSA